MHRPQHRPKGMYCLLRSPDFSIRIWQGHEKPFTFAQRINYQQEVVAFALSGSLGEQYADSTSHRGLPMLIPIWLKDRKTFICHSAPGAKITGNFSLRHLCMTTTEKPFHSACRENGVCAN